MENPFISCVTTKFRRPVRPQTYNPRQNLLSQTKIFSIFRQKSQCLLIQLKYSVNPPSPQVNVVCLDSGGVLHDFFRVREINNIDLGGKGGHLLFRSTFFLFVTRVLARIAETFLEETENKEKLHNIYLSGPLKAPGPLVTNLANPLLDGPDKKAQVFSINNVVLLQTSSDL